MLNHHSMEKASTLLLGGYVCVILALEQKKSNSGKNMLVINFDIAEGEYRGFYMDKYRNTTPKSDSEPVKWQGKYYLMLEGENWQERFKGFITSIEESNEGFKWDSTVGDEQTLKGKIFGGIFGEKECYYEGELRTNTKIRWVRSVKTIQEGKFTIPPKKTVPDETNAPFVSQFTPNDSELPF